MTGFPMAQRRKCAAREAAGSGRPRRARLAIGARQAQADILDPRFEEATLAGAMATPGFQRVRAECPFDGLATAADAARDDTLLAVHDGLGEDVPRLEAHQDDAPAPLAQHLHLVEADHERLALAGHAQYPVMARAEHGRPGGLVVRAQHEEGLALPGAADEIARLADEAVAPTRGEEH